jgi:hypothetical protein
MEKVVVGVVAKVKMKVGVGVKVVKEGGVGEEDGVGVVVGM